MIYATTSTLEDQVGRWWEAHGCPPDADLMDYVPRQSAETLKAWREWLRTEYVHWRNAADDFAADLEDIEPGEVSDDAGAAYDEASDNAEDCRLMFRAVTARLEEMDA